MPLRKWTDEQTDLLVANFPKWNLLKFGSNRTTQEREITEDLYAHFGEDAFPGETFEQRQQVIVMYNQFPRLISYIDGEVLVR